MNSTPFPQLQDPDNAAEYLEENLCGDDPTRFLFALRNVIEARGGLDNIVGKSGLDAQACSNLLRNFNTEELKLLQQLLGALDMNLRIQAH